MTTVHVVARGAFWRTPGGREFLRAVSITGRSWELMDGAAVLSSDATAALDAIVRGSGVDGSDQSAAVTRWGPGSRWKRTRRDVRPDTSGGDVLHVCELTDGELRELIDSGMPRAAKTRLERAIAAGAPPSGSVLDPITSARLRVSMRGRHGASRGAAPAPGTVYGAPAPATPGTHPAPVKRPNGANYFPRLMPNGETDVELVRRLHAEGVSVLLYGAPGTGKTALLEAALQEFLMVPGTSDTEAGDFMGAPVPEPGGSYRWVDGPLLEAAHKGLPLIVDEIALVDPRAMAVVYEAADGRGSVTVTSWPTRGTQTVEAGFGLHGACNPDAPGADMSEALLSRMGFQMEYGTDYAMAQRLGAPSKLVTCARNLDKQRREGEITWAPQMRELLAYVKIAALTTPELALQNLVACAPVMDRPVVSDVLTRAYGWQVDGLRLGEAGAV